MEGEGRPPFCPGAGETDGRWIEFPRARAGFSEAVRPCLRARPGRTGGGRGKGCFVARRRGAYGGERPSLCPRAGGGGPAVDWTVAAARRALPGTCRRAVCRSGPGSEGKQNRLRAHMLLCNRTGSCAARQGGTRLRGRVLSCSREGDCMVGQGGPRAGARALLALQLSAGAARTPPIPCAAPTCGGGFSADQPRRGAPTVSPHRGGG